ncbi:hypothetical protein ACE6H2_015415 [Prunus campanulata]
MGGCKEKQCKISAKSVVLLTNIWTKEAANHVGNAEMFDSNMLWVDLTLFYGKSLIGLSIWGKVLYVGRCFMSTTDDFQCKELDARCWLQDAGWKVLAGNCWLEIVGCKGGQIVAANWPNSWLEIGSLG